MRELGWNYEDNPMTMTDEAMAGLRALDTAATRGPWTAHHSEHGLNEVRAGTVVIVSWPGFDGLDTSLAETAANAQLIATARTALPDLLARLATRDAELAERDETIRVLRRQVERWQR